MGSSEGSSAGWAQDHRGVSTLVCICACMTLCVCAYVCVPRLGPFPPNPSFSRLEGGHQPGGGGKGWRRKCLPETMAPSHPWDPAGTSTPHQDLRRPGCLGNPAEKASQPRMKSLWPGLGSHQPGAAGFLQALHIWPGCGEQTDKGPGREEA